MTNEQIKEIVARAEDEHEYLKDRVHDLYDENVKLKEKIKEILNNKREIMVRQMLQGYVDYKEILYQLDEEIRQALKGIDKE